VFALFQPHFLPVNSENSLSILIGNIEVQSSLFYLYFLHLDKFDQLFTLVVSYFFIAPFHVYNLVFNKYKSA
jgi:hypothetical protein